MVYLSCHKPATVARPIAAACAAVQYLPAYSPDLKAIKLVVRRLKGWLGKAKARTFGGLVEAMAEALRGVRPGDILGCFRHKGYDASCTINIVFNFFILMQVN